MIRLMEASAGSGKTYNLAKTYIRLLLESNEPTLYRHILAVTFTNKATDEMKRRILKELHTLAQTPEESPYFDDFVPAVLSSADELRRRSRECLGGILHDYGAFAVSTIDRFFQQTLKAFSREIGQMASYQVELDKNALVDEAVDRVLDNLSEADKGLLKWLTDSAMESLEREGRFSLEKAVGQIARSLRSDRLQGELKGRHIEEMFSRENLLRIKEACTAVSNAFEKEVLSGAQRVLDALGAAGLSADDLKGRSLPAVADYAALERGVEVWKPSSAFLRDAPDPDKWFTKANQRYLTAVEPALRPAFEAFCALFDRPFKTYRTARILLGQISGLGIARELEEQFSALLKEKNVLSLDDSNTILKDIIDGSDAPFVYEKLGVRFEDFLLDEFQDTSIVQWENFLPLLRNSDAGGFENLVVGDVKQSIYRFRGSDWQLLAKRLPAEFPRFQPDPLDGNYRTLREIVEFNNSFFTFAAEALNLQDLYARVEQEVCVQDSAPGSVEVQFVENQDAEMEEILSTIRDLSEKGLKYSDIAILVRGNREGGDIAQRLIEEGIPVVSDDSLSVKSSYLVRLTVSGLALVDMPPTTDEKGRPSVRVEGYEAWAAGIEIPSAYDSLPSLAEQILRSAIAVTGGSTEGEVPYIQSFMDYLQDWTSRGGNDLPGFLKDWAESDPKISSPATGNSVRIMTIHKSKGLEFPFVILPFVEKIPYFKADSQDGTGYWCAPEVEGTPLEGKVDALFNVKFSSTLEDSLFARDLVRERELQRVDNLNILYVAMTRPRFGLKVIATEGKGDNMARLLKQYIVTLGGSDHFAVGQLYDFASIPGETEGETVALAYPSWPLGDVTSGDSRLKVSTDAADFFAADGAVGTQASQRLRGIAYHDILSAVRVPSDLEEAVRGAAGRGEIGADEVDAVTAFLRGKIASVKDRGWFPDSPSAILNEVEILDADGTLHRPDRVVVSGTEAIVIDYKFGEEKSSYRFQVGRYKQLLLDLGYTSVSGYLWYIRQDSDDIIEEIA